MNRNCILLDVDGVLAPVGEAKHRLKSEWTDWTQVMVRFDMWLSKQMGDAIKALASECDADLYWCTSWLGERESLALFAEHLGLNVGTVGELAYPISGSAARFKPSVAGEVALNYGYDRVVWFDDDRWPRIASNLKVVRPFPHMGLSSKQIDTGRKWLLNA
jgi:HAD domain in Swiss Army Knife RNA repair proteins